VEDDGEGMTEEERAQAILPFHSSAPSLRVGLGLPAAMGLVEQMGGRFTLDSERGMGTRVLIELP
jgi:signal transduction histidine kinase